MADGSFIFATIMKVPIEIAGKRKIAAVVFSDRLNIGFNLLGRKDVFDAFDEVVFRESSHEVEVGLKVSADSFRAERMGGKEIQYCCGNVNGSPEL